MAKKIKTVVKLQIPAGKATPAPPIGPALGQHGVNIGEFVSKFNEATREKGADIIPVEISVYDDRTFSFKMKTPRFRPVEKSRRGGKRFRQNSGKQSGEDNAEPNSKRSPKEKWKTSMPTMWTPL